MGFSLERKIIEEISYQSVASFLGFRLIEEIENLKGIENISFIINAINSKYF